MCSYLLGPIQKYFQVGPTRSTISVGHKPAIGYIGQIVVSHQPIGDIFFEVPTVVRSGRPPRGLKIKVPGTIGCPPYR